MTPTLPPNRLPGRTSEVPLTTVSLYGRSGPSARVRVFDWLDHLQIQAHTYTYLDEANASARTLLHQPIGVLREEIRSRLRSHRDKGTVLLSRAASPFSRGGVEARLLTTASFGVYDFDDALWIDSRSGLEALFSKSKIWNHATQAADRVIAGNEYLADAASKLNGDIRMVPSCVEPSRYIRKPTYELTNRPVLVWLGSPTTEKFLQLVADPLLAISRRYDVRLRIISAGNADLGRLNEIVERVAWTADGFATALSTADVGIAPLTDDAFSVGKCAYKLLQYGATCLPFVASPVGTNETVIRDLGALPASSPNGWIDALDYLLSTSSTVRSRLGASGLAGVMDGYSYAAWADSWRDALELPEAACRWEDSD